MGIQPPWGSAPITPKSPRIARSRSTRAQTFTLTPDGIQDVRTTKPGPSATLPAVRGNPATGPVVAQPAALWSLDDATGDATKEGIRGTACTIAGHESTWRRGVSGTALQFDGYFTSVDLPASEAPPITTALTLEAWAAIGAYPWNWAPLVQQGDDDGYFLGIDGHGYLGFKAKIVIARFNPDTGWGEWCDWYWTIYPDGIAAKRMRCWHGFEGRHEWHTGWPTMPPGIRPEDVMETEPFLTLIDLQGREFNHNWNRPAFHANSCRPSRRLRPR